MFVVLYRIQRRRQSSLQNGMSMRVLSVYGTRPEAIKMAPVVLQLESDPRFESFVCVTGQHSEMLEQVNDLFGIKPDIDLCLMTKGQGLTHITTTILNRMPDIFAEMKPDFVLVHGDTTTSISVALSAFYSGIPIGHVEAGLRTHNLMSPWPEEANRQLTSRLAKLHFAPTILSQKNLLAEGIPGDRIFVTGNTVIDALLLARKRLLEDEPLCESIADEFSYLDPQKRLILVTGHRRENHDTGIGRVCEALARLSKRGDIQVIYPVHLNPKVQEVADRVLSDVKDVFLVKPSSYLSFIWLMDRCNIVVTDSGGIQEEAPSLGKPVLVTRDTTERPEAIEAGTVQLVGTDPEQLNAMVSSLLDHPHIYEEMSRAHNPYGEGGSAAVIADILFTQMATDQKVHNG